MLLRLNALSRRALVLAPLAVALVAGCGSASSPSPSTAQAASRAPTIRCLGDRTGAGIANGAYRVEITDADVKRFGVSGSNATENLGVFTLRLDSGRWRLHQDPPAPVKWPDVSGSYVTAGDRVELTLDQPAQLAGASECKTWRLVNGDLVFEVISPDDPTVRAVWQSHPWRPVP